MSQRPDIRVEHGDCRDVLRALPDRSIDACVTDGPYALVSIVKRFANSPRSEATENPGNPYGRTGRGFMGQRWDTGETVHDPAFWREVWRVLKPGGHVVAMAATRTYHRLAVAIEDAGFEIRDMIAWLYGSGFPKSHDVAKGMGKNDAPPDIAEAWRGWGTALKPALEPTVVARKPLDGTVAANVLRHGTGALNIGACRIGEEHRMERPQDFKRYSNGRFGDQTVEAPVAHLEPRRYVGRFPANVIHDGSAEVVEAFPECETIGHHPARRGAAGMWSGAGGGLNGNTSTDTTLDAGSAARFFYTAKADGDDRFGSKHPTVKPVDLMAWLCRLVTPPGGTVLDPFAGSGTTGAACLAEGFGAVLIEREAAYVDDIRARLEWLTGQAAAPKAAGKTRRVAVEKKRGDDLPLFAARENIESVRAPAACALSAAVGCSAEGEERTHPDSAPAVPSVAPVAAPGIAARDDDDLLAIPAWLKRDAFGRLAVSP